MARNRNRNRHNAAFVVGSVLGGLAGAAVALWKTPYSGAELRERITGGTSDHTVVTATGAAHDDAPRFSSRLLTSVENRLAPLVGVELGKTANNGVVAPESIVTTPVSTTTGETGVAEAGTSSGDLSPEGIGHAASTEELTTPQVESTPEAFKEQEGEMKPFPNLGGNEPNR